MDERMQLVDWHEPITEDWLREVGFKWHQFDRQPNKQWLLWLGDAMGEWGASGEDLGVEVASGAYNSTREDHVDWFCWLRGDSAGRYHRFIHVRHIQTRGHVIRLVEGLTNQDWNPGNHFYGSVCTPARADRIRREDATRIDRQGQWAHWYDYEKDETRARPTIEHADAAIKNGGAK
jgi:hypothetical protein